MTAAFVIDCSITMAWCFSDESTPMASKVQDRLENETALVPAQWYLEVANVLARQGQRGARQQQVTDAIAEFDDQPTHGLRSLDKRHRNDKGQ